jgi:hypothetical protein
MVATASEVAVEARYIRGKYSHNPDMSYTLDPMLEEIILVERSRTGLLAGASDFALATRSTSERGKRAHVSDQPGELKKEGGHTL